MLEIPELLRKLLFKEDNRVLIVTTDYFLQDKKTVDSHSEGGVGEQAPSLCVVGQL
jgi:hypothetical protein